MVSDLTRTYFRTGFKRWIRWIALAVIFAIACGFLADWQWNRRVQVVKFINRLDRNYSHSLTDLRALMPETRGFAIKHEYRAVLVTGHYDAKKQLLLRDQVNNGNPGFDQLVPFVMADGRVIVIDRGWVSVGSKQDKPDSIPPLPAGTVKLVGRLIHAQQPDKRTAPRGEAMAIRMDVLNQQWHYKPTNVYHGAYLQLVAEDPKVATYPVLAVKPDITEGNHLSYAFQWVLFALMGFAAIFVNVRQDLREKRAATDPNFVPKPKRRKQGDADKEAEDALLGS